MALGLLVGLNLPDHSDKGGGGREAGRRPEQGAWVGQLGLAVSAGTPGSWAVWGSLQDGAGCLKYPTLSLAAAGPPPPPGGPCLLWTPWECERTWPLPRRTVKRNCLLGFEFPFQHWQLGGGETKSLQRALFGQRKVLNDDWGEPCCLFHFVF